MIHYIIATAGVGCWPDGCDIFHAKKYHKLEDARDDLRKASLTELGRKETNIFRVDITLEKCDALVQDSRR